MFHLFKLSIANFRVRGLFNRLRAENQTSYGQALAETALVLPILLLVILGIFTFGFIFWNYETLQSAVSAAGIALYDNGNAPSPQNFCNLVVGIVSQNIPGIDPSRLTYKLVLNNAANYPTQSAGSIAYGPFTESTIPTSCATPPTPTGGTNITLEVTYPCTAIFLKGVGSCTIPAISTYPTP